jgi:predicted esterase
LISTPAGHPSSDPHSKGLVLYAGSPLDRADCAVILLHGRNGSADDILSFGKAMNPLLPNRRLAWLAPEAAGRTWYPNSFLAPRATNEPWLSSALKRIEAVVAVAAEAGIGPRQIVIGGFSQGACLATEFVASHPAPYAGLIAYTGGLIGPPGSTFNFSGELDGMPALLLTGDPDPHVPFARVEESATVLTGMGAEVTLKRYPGRPHTVSRAEVELGQALVERVFS